MSDLLLFVLFLAFSLLVVRRLTWDFNLYNKLVINAANLYQDLDNMEAGRARQEVNEHFYKTFKVLRNIIGLTFVAYSVGFMLLFRFAPDVMAVFGIIFYIFAAGPVLLAILTVWSSLSFKNKCLQKILRLEGSNVE